MSKRILFADDARQAILKGTTQLSDVVRSTLGSKGQNVVLEQGAAPPKIVNDGVTIAKAIQFRDHLENVGALLMIQAAEKTNQAAGDGTTATIILAQEIFREGLKYIASGINQMGIGRGVRKAVTSVIEELKRVAKPIKKTEEVIDIAKISSNDVEMGKVIGEAMDAVGKDGVVTVEEWQGFTLEKEIVTGIQIERGFVSPYFRTDDRYQNASVKDPLIFLTTYPLENIDHISVPMQIASERGKSLVVIAPEIRNEALAMMIINKLNGKLLSIGVQAPGYGEAQEAYLQDLATLTGGTVISEKTGTSPKDVKFEQLGAAKKIISDSKKTIIIEGSGKKKSISARIQEVKTLLADQKNAYQREDLRGRLGKLTGKVAVIRVGAPTEPEIEDKKLRMEDALNATRSAIEEGILPGGGVALYKARKVLEKMKLDSDEQTGVNIVYSALSKPLEQVIKNAGKSIDTTMQGIDKSVLPFAGYNATTDAISNLVADGVIDPLKVIRVSLENASSVASLLLTANSVVYDDEQMDSQAVVKQLARAINPEIPR